MKWDLLHSSLKIVRPSTVLFRLFRQKVSIYGILLNSTVIGDPKINYLVSSSSMILLCRKDSRSPYICLTQNCRK